MSNTKIRTAGPQDLNAIKSIINLTELFPSEYLDDMFSGESDPNSGWEFWLTYDDSGVHGVAYCAPEEMTNGTWNLLLIAVHPEQQGQGIGRQLMSYVEDALKTMRVRMLLVETSGKDEFAGTRSFYEKIEYTREARIRDYYDVGDDKIVFRKALQSVWLNGYSNVAIELLQSMDRPVVAENCLLTQVTKGIGMFHQVESHKFNDISQVKQYQHAQR